LIGCWKSRRSLKYNFVRIIISCFKNLTITLTMFISNLKLWNFRKFGSKRDVDPSQPADLNLDFSEGLNVIIGENDSGKSAIIDAIKLVLRTHSYEFIRIEDREFFKDSNRFRIEIIFSGLDPEEAKNFTEWLGWTGSGKGAKPYLKVFYDVSRRGKKYCLLM
jgi:putative ATP-dependent endonuclease of OLD family